MKGLVLAIQFLTRIPMPAIVVSDAAFAASIRWFPAVGLIVGALIAAVGWAGARIDPWTGALAAVTAWTLVTGALHLDGLGDIADALGAAHKDPAKLRAVLADPHVGSFAVVAIGLQLLAKLVLAHALIEAGRFVDLALIPAAVRIGPLLWSRLPPLHPGLGARFHGAAGSVVPLLWIAALLGAGLFAPALPVALVLIPLWGWWLVRRVGGISGDGHGAGIGLVETGLLLAAAIVTTLA